MPGARRKEFAAPVIQFYSLIFLILVLDQISKLAAQSYLTLHDSVPIWEGVFHFTLVHNTGVAFGMFRSHETVLFTLITVSLFVLFWWGHSLKRAPAMLRCSVALILGGAVGNWIDRLRVGAVIDFLDFRIWPVFNLADSSITVGVALYLFILFRQSQTKPSKTT